MYKLILPLRYLVKRRITYFAFLAVALCTFIVVVVMTVMAGLVREFKQKNHRFVGDCVVGTESLVGFAYYDEFVDLIGKIDIVDAVSPAVHGYALLAPLEQDFQVGVQIIGVEPAAHAKTTGFGKALHYGSGSPADAFVYDPNRPELPGCVLGIDLAFPRNAAGGYTLPAEPVDDAFSLTCVPLTAKGAPAKAGTSIVSAQTFHFTDASQTGLPRVDDTVVYVPLEQAQALCGMATEPKRASVIHIRFKPGVNLQVGRQKIADLWKSFRAHKAGHAHANLLETVSVQDWKEYRRAVIAPLEKEQAMIGVMFGLVDVTTIFIILVVFYMIIGHKSKDIGILKSAGVSDTSIVQLFSTFAFLVGLLGSCLGTLAGWLFLIVMNPLERWVHESWGFELWDRTIFAIGKIPNQVDVVALLVIISAAIASCVVGALVPVCQVARLLPVESLRVGKV